MVSTRPLKASGGEKCSDLCVQMFSPLKIAIDWCKMHQEYGWHITHRWFIQEHLYSYATVMSHVPSMEKSTDAISKNPVQKNRGPTQIPMRKNQSLFKTETAKHIHTINSPVKIDICAIIS